MPTTLLLGFYIYIHCFLWISSSFFQTDLKKILAYSTISHCGYMFIPVFFNMQDTFIAYFYVHGVSKALSFTLIGILIQDLGNYQDSRKITVIFGQYSPSFYLLPVTLLTLSGSPFFLGFSAKYLVLESLKFNIVSDFYNLLLSLSTLLSFMYSLNTFYIVFFNTKKGVIFFSEGSYNYQGINIFFLKILSATFFFFFFSLFYMQGFFVRKDDLFFMFIGDVFFFIL